MLNPNEDKKMLIESMKKLTMYYRINCKSCIEQPTTPNLNISIINSKGFTENNLKFKRLE